MPDVIAIPKPQPVAYVSPTLASGTLNALATQVSGVGTTIKVFPNAGSLTSACALIAPGTYRLEGEPFVVTASGVVYSAGGTTTVAVSLLAVNGTTWANGAMAGQLTPGNWTTVYTTATPVTVATTTMPWRLTATCLADSMSGLMQSAVVTAVGATPAVAAGGTALTLASTTPGGLLLEPPIVFAVGITFNTSAAGNAAQLDCFYLAV